MYKPSMKKAARIALFLSCFGSVLVLTGCWDRIEVNDLALVTGAAIDKKEEKMIELSVQIFIPRSSGGGQQGMGGKGGAGTGGSQTLVRSAIGVTIADAMSKLQEELPRKLFWGHTDIFIFGESLAKEGIRDHVDFILRFPQARERSDILVSRGDAKKTLEALPPLERSSAEVLREMAKSKLGLHVTVKDLSQMLSGDAGAAALPWVEIMTQDQDPAKDHTIPYVQGTAVFKQDKLVGRIDDKVTRGVLWLKNEINRAFITFPASKTEGFVAFHMLNSKTELIPHIKNDIWSITAKIETEGDVIQNTTNLDMTKPMVIQDLEKQLEEQIEDRVDMALLQAQKEMKADIFNFAEAFHIKYPKAWRGMKSRWNDQYPKVAVKVDVTAKIRRPGMITSGGSRPKEEVKKE